MYRFTARIAFVLTVLAAAIAGALAQQAAPDYQVRLPNYSYSDDQTEVIMMFAVYNKGGDATQPASVELVNAETETIITREAALIPPLETGEVANFEVRFPATLYPPGSTQQIAIIVGRDEIEAPGTATFTDNRAVISVPIPFLGQAAPGQQQPPVPGPQPTVPTDAAQDDATVTIPLLDVTIDLNDPLNVALLAGIIAAGLVILIVIWLIFRVLFVRRPTFGTFQPPYANMPPLDPNTIYGRRQQWQQYAQNNIIPSPCKPGTIMPRKLLLGMGGDYLSGWHIAAVRMTQYDMYGRVSRSQVMASNRGTRRLDRLARRAETREQKKLAKRVRPIARRLARQFRKKVTRRSAMLAIALDVRLRGSHGEIRIVFELYECLNGRPHRLDQWEPEMTVIGKTIHETYTYTIFGQHGGETYRDFLKRLPGDVERMLVDMLRATVDLNQPTSTTYAAPSADILGSTQPVPAARNDDQNEGKSGNSADTHDAVPRVDISSEETPTQANAASDDDSGEIKM
ncbi:MAG: hypothetical protein ACOCYT_00605 [Chloroflexota bacterium]